MKKTIFKEKRVFLLQFNRFFVTLERFAGFLCIKAVWGIERKWVTNWRPYSIPLSAINCVKEHPTVSHQPYYDPSSGAKVIILFQLSKSIHTFFFRACSLFLQSLWHLIWHLPEKCVLGYVLLPNICDVSHTLGTLT